MKPEAEVTSRVCEAGTQLEESMGGWALVQFGLSNSLLCPRKGDPNFFPNTSHWRHKKAKKHLGN